MYRCCTWHVYCIGIQQKHINMSFDVILDLTADVFLKYLNTLEHIRIKYAVLKKYFRYDTYTSTTYGIFVLVRSSSIAVEVCHC